MDTVKEEMQGDADAVIWKIAAHREHGVEK